MGEFRKNFIQRCKSSSNDCRVIRRVVIGFVVHCLKVIPTGNWTPSSACALMDLEKLCLHVLEKKINVILKNVRYPSSLKRRSEWSDDTKHDRIILFGSIVFSKILGTIHDRDTFYYYLVMIRCVGYGYGHIIHCCCLNYSAPQNSSGHYLMLSNVWVFESHLWEWIP